MIYVVIEMTSTECYTTGKIVESIGQIVSVHDDEEEAEEFRDDHAYIEETEVKVIKGELGRYWRNHGKTD